LLPLSLTLPLSLVLWGDWVRGRAGSRHCLLSLTLFLPPVLSRFWVCGRVPTVSTLYCHCRGTLPASCRIRRISWRASTAISAGGSISRARTSCW
jgi:hypothetical protein